MKEHYGISSFELKVIAILCMTIDHIGAVLLPQYRILRVIGRVAFPIFAFLIVEGVYHTKNIKNYIVRLGAFALISEIPFDLAFSKTLFRWDNLNVFFTLWAGVICIYLIQKSNDILTTWVIILLANWSVTLLGTDYGMYGVCTILGLYYFRGNFLGVLSVITIVHGLFMGGLQVYALFALIPIYFYNGQRGIPFQKSFYYYYPCHLLILAGVRVLLL